MSFCFTENTAPSLQRPISWERSDVYPENHAKSKDNVMGTKCRDVYSMVKTGGTHSYHFALRDDITRIYFLYVQLFCLSYESCLVVTKIYLCSVKCEVCFLCSL